MKIIVFILIAAAVFCSCKKIEDDTKVSYQGARSHNFGKDCMSCHKDGGEGKRCFKLAGSIRNGEHTTIRVWITKPTGKIYIAKLNADADGNFYTTQNISFAEAANTSVYWGGLGAALRTMSDTISTGSCNSCHGKTTSIIGDNKKVQLQSRTSK